GSPLMTTINCSTTAAPDKDGARNSRQDRIAIWACLTIGSPNNDRVRRLLRASTVEFKNQTRSFTPAAAPVGVSFRRRPVVNRAQQLGDFCHQRFPLEGPRREREPAVGRQAEAAFLLADQLQK